MKPGLNDIFVRAALESIMVSLSSDAIAAVNCTHYIKTAVTINDSDNFRATGDETYLPIDHQILCVRTLLSILQNPVTGMVMDDLSLGKVVRVHTHTNDLYPIN